ncbi:type II secretion system F family protein [Natronobacterium gregoryi]|uniref:Flagella assembly protein j n=2 Tax=Natronobacterium gregoryi TaxID=44930 RepID=L0AF50_NATGS|nr:type II secretion system F family protein [Natronobacterium gregoryi]AFZ71757.1 archaeal flagella assembly protein J [Natronobacterium gregoryi SP2]ELY72858.1 type II secretion system protein F [Natronobacterium gregoryi SP2]PLK21062.1 flagella assembly protein j [Natronobacterium gregoryi SP2]SFI88536.1 flagellar protein FlaJ [Natronobacterium gregoryi]
MSLETDSNRTDRGSGTDGFGDAFYPLYDRLFHEDSEFVADVETKLAQARMTDTVELYLSRALGVGFISGLALWLIGLTLGYGIFATGLVTVDAFGMPIQNQTLVEIVETLRVPALVFCTGLVFGTVGFTVGFGSLAAIPYSRASARKREINMLLSDSVSFMYALSVGGLNQLEIIEAMAEADDTYGEVAKEFQSIVNETDYFDVDYRTAIRKQALETPSDELSQFLTDMLSIVNSGGDMENFLEDKKEKHMRTAKQEQELTLETLELFGEMYMTLSLFPLLLIIIMVVMQMIPQAAVSNEMLYLTVYALIPLLGLGFLVLVSTVKHDEPGDGYLSMGGSETRAETGKSGVLDLGLVEQYTGGHSVFSRIKNREGTHETIEVLCRPHVFFRDNPLLTLAITVPASLVIVATVMMAGRVPTSWNGMVANPIWGTFVYVYVPLYVIAIPLAIFREWNVRHRTAVVNQLSEDLRKLSSANDTGMTLLESLKSVADTTNGRLAREFEMMHTKVNYGTSLKAALIEFNNKYHIPRLARTTRLITEAQEASNQITDVLRTAARASENHDDIERERKSRTRMQVVIIIMTFMTVLAVIAILKTQFIDTMAGLEAGGTADTADAGSGGGELAEADLSDNVDVDMLSVLFFHAVTLQGIISGFICGYIRDANILSGLKYAVALATIALVGWSLVA